MYGHHYSIATKFPWSKNSVVFVNYSSIMKIPSQNAWLIDEEVNMVGTNNS